MPWAGCSCGPLPLFLMSCCSGSERVAEIVHRTMCSHFVRRWLRSSSDIFCSDLLDELQRDLPMKVKVFYTRQGDASVTDVAEGDGSRESSISSGAGKGRISRKSILEGVGRHVRAKLAEVVCLMSGPPGACQRRSSVVVRVPHPAPSGFVESATATLVDAGVSSERIVCLD